MKLTRNILDFYKNDKTENHWYLKKYFTNTDNYGYYEPHAKEAFMTGEEAHKYGGAVGTVDDDNTYEINRFGLRGEIYENPEVIAGGCSITFGIGVPEIGRWTNILGNLKNKSVMNLGSPGASVESVCNTIIQYCQNNKMPKEIFCLMPDFFRRMVVVDKEFYKSRTSKNSFVEGNDNLRLIYCNPIFHKLFKGGIVMEIENKKYIEDATSPHQLILNSINAIYALEAFCLSNNIKFYWTTWDLSSSLIMNELIKVEGFKIKNFKSFFKPNREDFNFWIDDNNHDLCANSEFSGTLHWDQGTDYSIENGKEIYSRAHPGVHFQFHIAKFFNDLTN
jgi:hypothetical protein